MLTQTSQQHVAPRERAVIPGDVRAAIGFWTCLLLAAGVYATVVLAPKGVRWSLRVSEFERNQQQLDRLQHQIAFGERLIEELQRNPEFRRSLDPQPALSAGVERIMAVDEKLRFQGEDVQPHESPRGPSIGLRGLSLVARSPVLQSVGLLLSATLLITAFTFFVERPGRVRRIRYWQGPSPHIAERRRLPDLDCARDERVRQWQPVGAGSSATRTSATGITSKLDRCVVRPSPVKPFPADITGRTSS